VAVGSGFPLASSPFTDFDRVNQDKLAHLADKIGEKWEPPRHKIGITGASTADGTR
jgi:hypothetical protein